MDNNYIYVSSISGAYLLLLQFIYKSKHTKSTTAAIF
jgi:hypothetical protein